jgi:small subunit ribosomal protein S16
LATKIRLKRTGAKKRPSYRVVVADARAPRDGKFVDTLGYYDPLTNPPTIQVDAEKALLWLSRGAQPTDTVRSLFRRAGVLKLQDERRLAAAAPVAEEA